MCAWLVSVDPLDEGDLEEVEEEDEDDGEFDDVDGPLVRFNAASRLFCTPRVCEGWGCL